MIRFLILIGYTLLMTYLQVSGQLNQYINVHYRYLAILSMILSFILAMAQLILWNKEEGKSQEKESMPHCTQEGHHHGLEKISQRVIANLLLALPLMVGFLFPTVSLDTSIVEAKGFNFPLSKESVGDPDIQTQYLKPDTSIYFEKSEYDKQMQDTLKNYTHTDTLEVTEENYLEVMELIYNYPSEFIGKNISYSGFVFHSSQADQTNLFVFRFGIIHCVADSGVFGLLTHMPEGETFKNNDWVKVTGTIQSQFYAPLKRELPMVDVSKVEKIQQPKNQYVYRSF